MTCELHRLHIWFQKDDDEERWAVHISELPGCCSSGESKEDALRMIAEALSGLLDSYAEDGEDVPWVVVEEPVSVGSDWTG